LAEDIYLNNKKAIGLDENLLAEYAQRILDRIIFSKFLEDRAIEESVLSDLVGKDNLYPRLVRGIERNWAEHIMG